MQPDWDKLTKTYVDTPNVVIAELDCAGEAQSVCGELGARGYPTIKLVVDGKMSDYNGARDFNGLKREVESKLNPKPACSLDSKDACSAGDRAILEESEKMSKAERVAKIKALRPRSRTPRSRSRSLRRRLRN